MYGVRSALGGSDHDSLRSCVDLERRLLIFFHVTLRFSSIEFMGQIQRYSLRLRKVDAGASKKKIADMANYLVNLTAKTLCVSKVVLCENCRSPFRSCAHIWLNILFALL